MRPRPDSSSWTTAAPFHLSSASFQPKPERSGSSGATVTTFAFAVRKAQRRLAVDDEKGGRGGEAEEKRVARHRLRPEGRAGDRERPALEIALEGGLRGRGRGLGRRPGARWRQVRRTWIRPGPALRPGRAGAPTPSPSRGPAASPAGRWRLPGPRPGPRRHRRNAGATRPPLRPAAPSGNGSCRAGRRSP